MRRIAALLALGLLIAACGSAEPSGIEVATPEELTADAAATMATITSAAFTMARSGAPVTIQGMVFDSAEGQYAAPNAAKAILGLTAGDLSVELGTIAIGDRVWLTNPLTGSWEELAAGTGFNPAIVFDPGLGWVPLLTTDLTDIDWLGFDDGADVIHGTVAAARVEFLTAGLVEAQSVEAEIHLAGPGRHIVRVEFTTSGPEGDSDWVIEMSDFDAPVTVEPPAGG